MNELIDQPISPWYMWFVAIGFLFVGIFWLIFAQSTMRRIEKALKADNAHNDFVWDGLGARIFSYAFAIVLPEKVAHRLNRLMDVKLIRSYATEADWWRGLFFLVITYLWLGVSLLGAALGAAGNM